MRIAYMCQDGFPTGVGGDDHRDGNCNGVIVPATGHSVLKGKKEGHMISPQATT